MISRWQGENSIKRADSIIKDNQPINLPTPLPEGHDQSQKRRSPSPGLNGESPQDSLLKSLLNNDEGTAEDEATNNEESTAQYQQLKVSDINFQNNQALHMHQLQLLRKKFSHGESTFYLPIGSARKSKSKLRALAQMQKSQVDLSDDQDKTH